MPQWGDIENQEHDDADVNAKRVKLYGWDSNASTWLKIVVDVNGQLQITGAGDGSHFHDGDTLQLDGINSDGGTFDFITSGAINFKPSGDLDDYLSLSTDTGRPSLNVVGGDDFYLLSDDVAAVGITLREDASNYGRVLWNKTAGTTAIFSTGEITLTANSDVNDFLKITTSVNQTTLNWEGQDGKITADNGTIDFDDEALTTTGSISCAPTLTVSDSAADPPLNVTERSAVPSSPSANDIYLDDGTNTGSGNPGWRRYTGAAWEDITAAAGGGNPAGADSQLQYNDGGSAFGGIADLTWDDTNLLIGGTSGSTQLQFRSSANAIYSSAVNNLDVLVGTTLNYRVGSGDITFNYIGSLNTGTITWANATANFEVSDDIFMQSTSRVVFGSAEAYINSDGVGFTDFHAKNSFRYSVEATNTDTLFDVLGTTNNGQYKWMEDEDYFEFVDDILMTTTEKIFFRDTAIFIHSNADGEMTIEADTKVTIGVAGDIVLGDGTQRDMYPQTDLKIDLGKAANRINEGWIHELHVQQSTTNISDPPTDAELDSIFGTPAALGRGFIGTVDDASLNTDVWLVYTSDTSWFYLQGTKAV